MASDVFGKKFEKNIVLLLKEKDTDLEGSVNDF